METNEQYEKRKIEWVKKFEKLLGEHLNVENYKEQQNLENMFVSRNKEHIGIHNSDVPNEKLLDRMLGYDGKYKRIDSKFVSEEMKWNMTLQILQENSRKIFDFIEKYKNQVKQNEKSAVKPRLAFTAINYDDDDMDGNPVMIGEGYMQKENGFLRHFTTSKCCTVVIEPELDAKNSIYSDMVSDFSIVSIYPGISIDRDAVFMDLITGERYDIDPETKNLFMKLAHEQLDTDENISPEIMHKSSAYTNATPTKAAYLEYISCPENDVSENISIAYNAKSRYPESITCRLKNSDGSSYAAYISKADVMLKQYDSGGKYVKTCDIKETEFENPLFKKTMKNIKKCIDQKYEESAARKAKDADELIKNIDDGDYDDPGRIRFGG
jgi:hypothetical protein